MIKKQNYQEIKKRRRLFYEIEMAPLGVLQNFYKYISNHGIVKVVFFI